MRLTLVLTLALAVSLTGCVSQGEFDATLAKLDRVEADLAAADTLRVQALADLAEARACLKAALDYMDADHARITRQLLGGGAH